MFVYFLNENENKGAQKKKKKKKKDGACNAHMSTLYIGGSFIDLA